MSTFGVEKSPGMLRRPILEEAIMSDFRRHVHSCTTMRQQHKDHPIGHNYIVVNPHYEAFKPDLITAVENQINQIKQQQKASRILNKPQIITASLSKKQVQMHISSNSAVRVRTGPCFFGHKRTSAKDIRGRPVWNATPDT